MKIRKSFVSNSSSSSFIAVGVSVDKEAFKCLRDAIEEDMDEDFHSILEEMGLFPFMCSDDGLPDGSDPIIGEMIQEFDGETYGNDFCMDFDTWYKEIIENKEKIDRLFLKYNIKNEGKFKILSGIRSC